MTKLKHSRLTAGYNNENSQKKVKFWEPQQSTTRLEISKKKKKKVNLNCENHSSLQQG
jgi:uncharacterized Fe-S cluster-containing radical SAM superfamily protein